MNGFIKIRCNSGYSSSGTKLTLDPENFLHTTSALATVFCCDGQAGNKRNIDCYQREMTEMKCLEIIS